MDVHKDSITMAVLPAAAATASRVDRLPNDLARLKRYLEVRALARALCGSLRRTSGSDIPEPRPR
jgi:hypothetical protein